MVKWLGEASSCLATIMKPRAVMYYPATVKYLAHGTWYMDEEEWCHFTVDGDIEISSSAPSPWMLQDIIADWYEKKEHSG